jgi:hypothetical protein
VRHQKMNLLQKRHFPWESLKPSQSKIFLIYLA